MKIIQVTLETVTEEVARSLQSKEESCIYCIAEKNAAVVGTNHGANLKVIEDEQVKLIQISHEGGTIVLSPGDVDIGIFTKDYSGDKYREEIINRIIGTLVIDKDRITREKNDILIDGKKVIGYGSRMYGDILYTAIHVSINANLELIKKICTKPMEKIPGSLSDFYITSQHIEKIIYEVLK